ncbi:MAG: tetratricopeptide repeat protein [Thermoflexales bacterium]|nr:tetratricopeptide repeat protein [Thermoflexales bacterium]
MKALIPHFIQTQFERQVYDGRFGAASLFVDISGFTQLTETLMKHHKDGAEVLTEVLNQIFQPIVHTVYAHGGFVATFAGDAFTALFPEGRSPQRAALYAAQAAFSIQGFFSERPVAHTRYGDFPLDVKIGLGTGAVHWRILGQAGQYTHFFRGPAVDTCAYAEHYAKNGEVLASPGLMPRLQGHVQARPIEPHFKLSAPCLELPPKKTKSPRLAEATVRAFALNEVVDLSAPAEFRNVASVFISFEEPSEATRLDEFVAGIVEAVASYGGYFNKLDFGDKGALMLVLFGAPIAHEDDLERAADFLLGLSSQAGSVRWRAGLSYGTVYAGFMGGEERCEYTAIGDVVNLSARLMGQAAWGEIWTPAPLARQLQRSYRLERVGRFTFKGKSEPTLVHKLTRKRIRGEKTPFSGDMVGRQAELAQLEQFLAPAFEGKFAGVAHVRGEAGVGKSRLVYALKQRLNAVTPLPFPEKTTRRDGKVTWFTCPAEGILHQSLNPFKRFLQQYFDQYADRSTDANKARFNRVLDKLIADLSLLVEAKSLRVAELSQELERLRPFLGAMVNLYWEGSLYEQLEPKLRFENTLAAFKTLILAETLRQGQAVILELEDAQLLDPDSQTLIQALTRNIGEFPLALIAVCRNRDDGTCFSLPVEAIMPQIAVDLDVMGAEDMAELATHVLKNKVSPALAAFLAEKSGGNPFFAEQLALDLRERGMLRVEAETECLTLRDSRGGEQRQLTQVPGTINAVLITRLDRLMGRVKEIVQTAAVLGREFQVQILSQMLRQEQAQLQAGIKTAEEEQIWLALSEWRYVFKHALMRDAAYDMQLRARLRELHGLAARAIEQVYAAELAPYYADLAYHCDQAGTALPAARWYRLAGEEAARQFANAQAIGYLSRALELTPPEQLAERYTLLLEREKVYNLQGERKAQARDLSKLLELAMALDGAWPGPMERAPLDAPAYPGAWQAEVTLRLANYALATSDYPAAMIAAQKAIELAHTAEQAKVTGQPGSTWATEAEGYLWWGHAMYLQADYEAAQAKLEQAMVWARQARVRWIEALGLQYMGNILLYQGNYTQTLACWEQALGIYRETGNRQGEANTLNNLSVVAWNQGNYADAINYFRESLRLCREIGNRPGEAKALVNLGIVFKNQGDYATAQSYFQDSQRIFQDVGNRLNECTALQGLALLSHHLGDDEAAYRQSQQGLHLAQELGARNEQGLALKNIGHALLGLGRLDEAAQAYQQAMELQRELGQHNEAIEPLAGLARVALARGQAAQAQAHVQEILDHLETGSLSGAEEPFEIYLSCYQVLDAAGDPRALEILNAAHDLLHQQAAQIGSEELQQSFLYTVPSHRRICQAWDKKKVSG